MKEVLVVYYSQTGQLFDIINNIVSTLKDENINITYHEIIPKKPFPFPWKEEDFLDAFPDSFLQTPHEVHPPRPEVMGKKYDLVILGHQVWYLSPSIPLNSFLKSDAAKKLLHDTQVVTVIGARNMWYQSQEKLKRLLINCKAKLVGNIALVDRHINHLSVITIQHWMLRGKKDRYLGIFPKPGVSKKDISEAKKFGRPIKACLLSGDFSKLQDELLGLNAVTIKPALIQTDKRGNVIFSKWAALVTKKSKAGTASRKRWLRGFKYYLQFAIWIIAPIVFIVFLLTYVLFYRKIQKDIKYYSSVDLK
ncbi:dialkylresorcinol condensing enzyme DarA [Flavobacteriaceae bacterium TP-CH-4]|uniref:Dialkylresorcinol condensing enzyme DarA n=1 Tax=Pelagihabitans pacificus TaxID=2696054 RepID=A0A967E7T2_9FLAO|nr:dialkylrecorsinol condensing enzyme DarA [Pelagihabitans pacificus]NHF60574.1 dialkylresorcinol condensing enzyme DarA [Pelagihabitans pacificus]